MTHRTAIIGDIGGHVDVFVQALQAAGVNTTTWQIPDHLSVVQVGDLVHKGPYSAQCVQLANTLLEVNLGRYIQLVGNHEAHYLGGPDVSARSGVTPVDKGTEDVLRRWWSQQTAKLAVAVTCDGRPATLITHGGLTCGLWTELGRPHTAALAADAINALATDPAAAFRPGWLMTGVVDYAAGVTNPRTGAELAASWLQGTPMPFDQVHGHEGAWLWTTNNWHDDVPPQVRLLTTVDHEQRFSTVHVPGGKLTSVDWVLGTRPPERHWAPLILDGRPHLAAR